MISHYLSCPCCSFALNWKMIDEKNFVAYCQSRDTTCPMFKWEFIGTDLLSAFNKFVDKANEKLVEYRNKI